MSWVKSYQDKSQDAREAHVPHSKSDGVREAKDCKNPLIVDNDCS